VPEPTDTPFTFGGQKAFEALSAAVADAVLVVGDGGGVVYAGPSLVEVLGLDPREVEGRPLLDLVHPDDAVQDEPGGFWATPLPFEREFRMRTGSGEWAWVRVQSSAADRDGRRPAAVAEALGDRALLLVRDRTRRDTVRDAQDLIHRAFDAVNNLVVVTDVRVEDNPLVVVNQNFVETTGYERSEIVGQNCRFLQVRGDGTRDDSGDGQREALDAIRTAVERGASTEVVLRNYRKDGALFYNRLYLTPIRNGAGEVTHFVGVQNDVTGEVEQRQRADEQGRLLQAFFESAPFLMGVVEYREGRVLHRAANRAALRLFGASGADVDDVDGAEMTRLGFTDGEAAVWARHVERAATSGEPVHFETTFPWGSEAGGEGVRELDVTVTPAHGADPLFAYVSEDVTERRADERERGLLAAAVSQAAESIIVTGPALDPPGPEIVYANDAHLRLFGYRRDEVVGRSPRMYQGPKTDRAALDQVRRALEAGEPVESEAVNYRKDRSAFVLQWEIAPVRDGDGRVVNWVGTQRDVTERRRLEREVLEASAREQERMARELHDGLGQVLTGAAFKLQALDVRLGRDGVDPAALADLRRTLELVEAAHQQARAIARGLFPVDVEADGLMAALERLAADAGAAFGVDCSFVYDRPVVVQSKEDAGHLYRIVQEALANAARHGRAEAVVVSVSHGHDGVAALTVQDDGVGIPDGALDEGGGLGLRTMRLRADRVGGGLDVRRLDGGGTAVTVRFMPAAPSVEA
jgi:PAS domain S-box-containing protein